MAVDIVSLNIEYVRIIVLLLFVKRNCTNAAAVWLFGRIRQTYFSLCFSGKSR